MQVTIKSNNDFKTSGLLYLISTSTNTNKEMERIPASNESNKYCGVNIYF
jgi:hypothetical protein